jgi:hypothetical protein
MELSVKYLRCQKMKGQKYQKRQIVLYSSLIDRRTKTTENCFYRGEKHVLKYQTRCGLKVPPSKVILGVLALLMFDEKAFLYKNGCGEDEHGPLPTLCL